MKLFWIAAFSLAGVSASYGSPLEIPFDTELIIRSPKVPAGQVRVIAKANDQPSNLTCNISCDAGEIISGVVCNNHLPPQDGGTAEIVPVYKSANSAVCSAPKPMGQSCIAMCLKP